jgi:pimeloyl-ACP methyl ester carboxylesterase
MLRRLLFRLIAAIGALVLLVAFTLLGFRIASQAREVEGRVSAAPPSGRYVTAADAQLYVQEAGPAGGVPVLLVHGLAAWSETWRATIDALTQAGYRVIAIDLPPFGYSFQPANQDYSTAAQARRVLGVLDALKIDSAVLIGHSLGARAVVEAAISAADRIRALVLVAAALGLQEPPEADPGLPVRALLAIGPLRNAAVATVATNPLLTGLWLRTVTQRHDALTDDRVAVYRRPQGVTGGTEAFGQWLRHHLLSGERPNSRQPLLYRNLGMPTLAIWGDADTVAPLAQAQHLVSLIPGASLKTLPGIGHIPQLEDPRAFNALLAGELARLLAPR